MIARRIAGIAVVVAAVAAVALVLRSGDDGHRLNAVFQQATHIRAGLEVSAAGQKVGTVEDVETSGATARLGLKITEEAAWPLPKGTTAQLRWNGTTTFGSRYVELRPGPAEGPPLADGALIELDATTSPVELDRVLRSFDTQTRGSLRTGLERAGATFGTASDDLRGAVDESPPALAATRGLLADLGADPQALDALVRSTDRVVASVNGADPGIEPVVADLATTFDAVASEAAGLRQTLADAPGTLAAARGTLARADGTLIAARDLTATLAPGIREARTIATPTNNVLRRLLAVGPLARGTLSSLRVAAPDLTTLLDRAAPLMPKLESIGRRATRQVHCITPYGPEIIGFPTTWGGFLKNGDDFDKYGRIHANALPYPENAPLTSKQAVDIFPGASYAFPRPPGQNVGKPWFIDECGVGPETLDASKDPEARPKGGVR